MTEFVFNHLKVYTINELPECHPHAHRVRHIVLRECAVDIDAFVGTSRMPRVVMARMLCVRLLRLHSLLSYPQIATAVTPGRGHSSVLTMDHRLDTQMDMEIDGKRLDQWTTDLGAMVKAEKFKHAGAV